MVHEPTTSGAPADAAIRRALTYLVATIAEEVVDGTTVWNRYGGGFEVIYLDDGRFRPLSDITYLFWRVDIDDDGGGVVRFVPTALKQQHEGDLLVISRWHLEDTPTPSRVERLELHAILPIDRSATSDDWAAVQRIAGALRLRSEYLCVSFVAMVPARLRGRIWCVPAVVGRRTTLEPLVTFHDVGGADAVVTDPKLIRQMLGIIQRQCPLLIGPAVNHEALLASLDGPGSGQDRATSP
jgi:hypothetical protein